MVKILFFRPEKKRMKNILSGHITIKIFDSNGEFFFLGKKIKNLVTVVLSLNTSFLLSWKHFTKFINLIFRRMFLLSIPIKIRYIPNPLIQIYSLYAAKNCWTTWFCKLGYNGGVIRLDDRLTFFWVSTQYMKSQSSSVNDGISRG